MKSFINLQQADALQVNNRHILRIFFGEFFSDHKCFFITNNLTYSTVPSESLLTNRSLLLVK